MATTLASVWGLNENGEIVATAGTGSNNVVGYVNQDGVPLDESGKLVVAGLGAGSVQAPYVVISGTPTVGNMLTASAPLDCEIRGPLQWTRNGVAISGATKYSYIVTADDIGASLNCTATVTRPLKIPTGPGYKIVAGTQFDPWATTYNQATWSAANSGGAAVLPTLAAPRVTLTTGTTSGNFGRAIHRAPFTFSGLKADDCIVLDLEFPAPGPELNDSITLIFSSDGYTSKSMQLGFGPTGRYVDGRIQFVFKLATDFNPANGEVFDGTTFNYMSIRYSKGSSSPGVSKQCIVHGLYINPKARPKMMFEFDLGHSGVYNIAKNLFAERGIKGSVMITRAMIDTPGFMTTAQLQELYTMGWDMGVRNGPTHDTFTSVASLTAEMLAARQWNIDRGLVRGSDHCIYPVGVMTANSREALKNAGFKTARTTTIKLITTDVGVPDMYNLPTIGLGGAGDLYAIAKPYMDDARKYGKTCRMYTHDVADGGVSGGISTVDLTAILDDMKTFRDSGTHDICTITEWHNGLHI